MSRSAVATSETSTAAGSLRWNRIESRSIDDVRYVRTLARSGHHRAYLVGFLAIAPFMYLSFYEDAAAKWLNGVDIAFFVGTAVAAVVYYLLSPSLDLDKERAIIEQADARLEEVGELVE